MSPEPQIAPADLRRAFNRVAADQLRAVAAGLGLMYAVYTVMHSLMLPPHQAAPLMAFTAVSALLLGALYARLRRQPILPRWGHPVGSLVAVLMLVNVIVHIAVTNDPHKASMLTLLIIGVAVLLLDRRWAMGMIALTWISGVITLALLDTAVQWDEFVYTMFGATVLGVVVHVVRRRALVYLEVLRRRDAERQDQLAAAVIAAQQSEERFRKLSGAAFEGLLFHDDGRVLDMNRTLLGMLGYTLEEARTKTIWDLTAPESHALIREKFGVSAEDAYEVVGRRKDGSTFPIDVCAKSIPVPGGGMQRVVAVRDITQRKEIEAEREQVIAELDSFAHTVAHDLKNPTALVLSYAQLLGDEADNLSPEHMHTIVTQIAQQSIRLVTIIDELLLLAQVRHGDVPLESIVMGTVITNMCFRISPLQMDTSATLEIPDSWPVVLGYGPWVEEVWYNYVCNAMKYGGQPPQITLGATPQPDGTVRFWVRDNGKGITPEEQRQLFKPFQRLQGVGTKGYGLGLSIVQRIVHRLGGEVGVESTPGAGSTFYFTLRSAGHRGKNE